MAGIDVNALVADIKSAAKGVLSRDVSTLRGFAEEQVKAIAQQAAIVAAGIADSSIGPDIRDFFLDSLEEIAKSFANTLGGMTMVMIEQVWNAIVKVVWDAINKATGLSLVTP